MSVELHERSAPARRRRAGMRLAVVSTPRSGNTWLRHLLAASFGLEQAAVHNPADIPWRNLPARYIVQLHWQPTAELLGQLRQEDFQVITLSRHPLSVLISILHFAPHHPNTVRWLEGEGGSESAILGVLPRSRAFLEWACGPRARALLSVTPAWWSRQEVVRVRYEELYHDPIATMESLATRLVARPVRPLREAVEIYRLDQIQDVRRDQHAWKALPDLWKQMFPKAEAERIAAAHQESFAILDYSCDADETLDGPQADMNWLNAEFAALWEQLNRARARIAWLVEQHEKAQLGIVGRWRKALVERFPNLVGTLKRMVRRQDS